MFKTIARRIASSYIVILLALVIITGVTIRHAIEAREISDRVINVRVPTVEHETELAFAIRDSRTALNRWIVLREQEPLDTHAQAWSKIDEELNKLRSLSDSWLTEARRQKLSAIERELGTLRSKQASLKEHVSTSGTFDETARAQDAEVATAATNVLSLLEELREEQHLVLAADLRFSDSQSEQLLITIIVLLVVSVVGATILGTVTTRSIVRPVNRSVTLADEIASGRFEGEIAVHGVRELERLAASMDTMRRNLKTLTEDLKKQNERKTQLANFNNTLRGEQTPEKLSENVLSFLAPLYDIQIAAFFLGYDDKTYHLVASYGYTKRKNLSNVFSLAEGLVGQAAYERKPITITKAPEDYIVVRSGLGEAAPRNIMVVPVQFEGRVLGVMEFGSLHDFDEGFGEIIKESIENVGIAIYSALARKRMRELLEQTQTQAEELQTQQEELRTANEELEEQARRLQQSEEELRTQSEELRATNEELEEKTKYLEQQKQRIEDKNTEVESARRNIERKAQELAVASKYKSEFLANMSHELRTPLNSLLILAKSLAENEGGNLTPEQIESAKIIHSGGHDLLNLINDILDLSKVEAGKLDVQFESIEAESIGKALRRQFDPVAKERNLAFDIKIEDDLSLVTDRHRLTQILKNLLSNAFKFTSKGGVTLNIATARELPKQFSGRWDGEAVIAFSVTDTGVGIPEDKQHVIFEAFQQADGSTSRKYGGTGLGLTISRELARLLGGELHLVSKEDQGSTFTCFLP
ncbi:MAG: ATP-binding protein, partial [Planctomycetes bacterium]|nr:ATP-binding protein [Planctomycetota bacterium]